MSAEGVGKATAGPWEFYPASNFSGFVIAPRGTLPVLCCVERPRGNPEVMNVTAVNFPGSTEANARLIAEAGTVLHETGKSPRQLADEVERLRAELLALRLFAADVLDARDGSLDGFDIETIGVARGLLEVVEAEESCGEGCVCADLGLFPNDCYRPTAIGAACYLAEQQQTAGDRG